MTYTITTRLNNLKNRVLYPTAQNILNGAVLLVLTVMTLLIMHTQGVF